MRLPGALLVSTLLLLAPNAAAMYCQICKEITGDHDDVPGEGAVRAAVGLALLPAALALYALYTAKTGLETAKPVAEQAAMEASEQGMQVQGRAGSTLDDTHSDVEGTVAESQATEAPSPDLPTIPEVSIQELALPEPSVDSLGLVPSLPSVSGSEGEAGSFPASSIDIRPPGALPGYSSPPLIDPAILPMVEAIPRLASSGDVSPGSLNLASAPGSFVGVLDGIAGALPLHILVAGSFALGPLLWLYNRLEKSRLLDSGRRRDVLAYVKSNPGATAADLASALGVFYNTARRHLDLLAEHGLLHRRPSGSQFRYFENHGRFAPEEERVLGWAARPRSRAFLRAVAARPGLNQRDLAIAIGLAPSTVCERVRLLAAEGLVENKGGLRVTPTGLQALAALDSAAARGAR